MCSCSCEEGSVDGKVRMEGENVEQYFERESVFLRQRGSRKRGKNETKKGSDKLKERRLSLFRRY